MSGLERGDDPALAALSRADLVAELAACKAALKRQEEQMRAYQEAAPRAIAMFDADMRYIYASAQWLRDYGLSSDDIIGRSHYDVFPEIPEHWKEIHRRCLSGETQRSDYDSFVRGSGRVQLLAWEVRPWFESTGKIGGLIMVTEEITTKQQALIERAAERERLEAALEMSDAAVWEVDLDSGQRYTSKGFTDFTGLCGNQLQPSSYQALVHPEDLPGLLRTRAIFFAGGQQYIHDHRLLRVDGQYRWIRTYVKRLNERLDKPRILGFFKDITSLKEAEAESYRQKLEADRKTAEKSEFLAMMSHEIRTLMNGVFSVTTALGRTSLDPHQRRMLNVMQSSGADLLALLSDLLDFSKFEAGKIRFSENRMSLQCIAGGVCDLFAEAAREKGITLERHIEPQGDIYLRGDEIRIRQILNNLVSNAIKVTREGFVRLSVRYVPQSGDEGLFVAEVTDSGIGISEAELGQIFKPFVQLHPDFTRGTRGTGLGLVISKSLAEQMGGGLEVESTYGTGSVFRLSLPLRRDTDVVMLSPPKRSAKAGSENANLSGVRVLVVDDSELNREVTGVVLRSAGADVVPAESGARAIEIWQEGSIDLILMDWRMPGMDGNETSRQIRAMECEGRLWRTPIIALTADATVLNGAPPQDVLIDDVVLKPIEPRPLFAAISALLEESCALSAQLTV